MKKRPREPKPLLPVLASATGPALIKHLASCNTTVRSQSLRLIHSWLASQSQELSEYDIKCLWKGLFYCLWHADKSSDQVALIERLTSLFLSLQPPVSVEFFRTLLLTLRREWPGIDRLRLEKFYLLIRRFVKALFELMRSRNWDVDALGEYFRVLERDGLLAEDKMLQGNGVNYHVVFVFLEELKGVGFPVSMEVVDVILRPYLAVLLRSEDKVLLGKVKTCFFDELLKMGKELLLKKRMGVEFDEHDGDILLGVVALRMGLSGRLYEVGSSVDCVQGNRKVVLGLREEFLKLEKDLESSGIEISVPEYRYVSGDGDSAEVPPFIPIELDENKSNLDEDQSGNDIFKKSKQEKKRMDGDDIKKKKKKNDEMVLESIPVAQENRDSERVNGAEIQDVIENDGTAVCLNTTMISNLQKQFEKVAAEMGSDTDEDSESSETTYMSGRRKRPKSGSGCPNENETTDDEVDAAAKSADKGAKRVRFSMKNNLVWKPQNPLPPESLRLPPSVMPRGSALKKGVAPGPVVEMRDVVKKVKVKQTKKKRKKTKKTK